MEVDQLFLKEIQFRLEDNWKRIELCLKELDDSEIWETPNPSTNSIGNLMLHLIGNLSHYIHRHIAGWPYHRKREKEFSDHRSYDKSVLQAKLKLCIKETVNIIKNLEKDTLTEEKIIDGNRYSRVGILIHVVQHFAYHTGQIVYWTKAIKNKDLGYQTNYPPVE